MARVVVSKATQADPKVPLNRAPRGRPVSTIATVANKRKPVEVEQPVKRKPGRPPMTPEQLEKHRAMLKQKSAEGKIGRPSKSKIQRELEEKELAAMERQEKKLSRKEPLMDTFAPRLIDIIKGNEDKVAIIDADSLIYLAAWGAYKQEDGEKSLDRYITEIVEHLSCTEAFVFVRGDNNFRHDVNPNYKGTRKIDPDYKFRVERLYKYAMSTYTKSDGGEADDYCGIYAQKTLESGKLPIICHIDKDLNMLPGVHYNYKNKDLYYIEPEEAHIFLMKQLITGDASDNIKGLFQHGPKTATKIVDDLMNCEMLDYVIKVWSEKGGEDWERLFMLCANCILIRSNEDQMRELSWDELYETMNWVGEGPRYNSLTDVVMKTMGFLQSSKEEGPGQDLNERYEWQETPEKLKAATEKIVEENARGEGWNQREIKSGRRGINREKLPGNDHNIPRDQLPSPHYITRKPRKVAANIKVPAKKLR